MFKTPVCNISGITSLARVGEQAGSLGQELYREVRGPGLPILHGPSASVFVPFFSETDNAIKVGKE